MKVCDIFEKLNKESRKPNVWLILKNKNYICTKEKIKKIKESELKDYMNFYIEFIEIKKDVNLFIRSE